MCSPATQTRRGATCTLTEAMELRDLKQLVWEPSERRQELTLRDILLLELQAATGLAYMHARGFVHRDVACRNIFVDAKLDKHHRLQRNPGGGVVGLKACIADFGRTVRWSAQAGAMGVVATKTVPFRESAPEVLKNIFALTSLRGTW